MYYFLRSSLSPSETRYKGLHDLHGFHNIYNMVDDFLRKCKKVHISVSLQILKISSLNVSVVTTVTGNQFNIKMHYMNMNTDITVSADISNRSFQSLNTNIQSDYHYNSKSDRWAKKNVKNLDIDISKRHETYKHEKCSSKDSATNRWCCLFPFFNKKNILLSKNLRVRFTKKVKEFVD